MNKLELCLYLSIIIMLGVLGYSTINYRQMVRETNYQQVVDSWKANCIQKHENCSYGW